jgi:BirA family biotin operon repressor/biotin-[acetyl-CoA-carboxylase] ligase
MILPREEWLLDSHRLGRRVLIFDCVDSTNTLAASLADDVVNDGVVVLAEEQTAGRGQHGRTWHCQRGAGVLLSVLLFPPPNLRRPVILAAWAANAVCATIGKSTGLQATIKWPNDVLIQQRKVCGILIEQGRGTVVGIGLNLNQSAESFAAAELPHAASLAIFAGRSFDCRDLARLLIHQLDDAYQHLCEGDLDSLEADWKRQIGLLGQQVLVECHDATYCGRLRELGWDGLELEVPGAETIRLLPESVRHLMPA